MHNQTNRIILCIMCMFGSTCRGAKIDSDMFGCFRVEMILPPELILLVEARTCSF